MAATVRPWILFALAATGIACGDFAGGAGGSASTPQLLSSATASTAGINAFGGTLYPILRNNCLSCHAGSGPGSPHIAHPSTPTAYENVVGQGKVDLANPQASRIVQKVGGGHECWVPVVPPGPGEDDCDVNAATLLAAVAEWADIIDFGAGGVSIEETLASSTLTLADGIEDVGTERYSENLSVLYEFKTGSGDIIYDVSGNDNPINLDLSGDYEWLSSWGIQFNDAKAVGRNHGWRLYDEIASPATGTGQFTVEAWATPANTVQEGPARIVTYSRNTGQRNFTLGQNQYNYVFRNRALLDEGMPNGTPALETYDADQDAQDVLQHVVITYDQYRGRRIHVNGVWTDDLDEQGPGRIWNWERNGSVNLALGDEVSNDDRHWEGQLRLVAIYDQALTDSQILQNFQAGVGKRLLMRFDISQWTSPGSAIEFVVSEFDNYSYLFCEPTYKSVNPSEFRIANIRIAINGVVPPTGQGFRRIDTQVTSSQKLLSRQCSVVPKGDPATDTFTLVFEHLNNLQNLVDEGMPGVYTVGTETQILPERGLRDFARMNETMSLVTRIDPLDGPQATYLELRQQLPVGYDLRSFVSSQQVGIAKLSLEYCDLLVEADALLADADPDKYFPGFPFGEAPETAFDTTAERNLLFDPLYLNMVGSGLLEQPTLQGVRDDLDPLVDTLLVVCTPTEPCDPNRTLTMAKGICSAVLSSAALSIH